MIAIPAIDLRGGACVQLVGGDFQRERVRMPNPIAVAQEWARSGFSRVHVVDLDAATGHGSDSAVIERLLDESEVQLQVGGGLRTTAEVEGVLEHGARYAVVSTRALDDLDWLGTICRDHPGQIIVAIDVRERQVVTRGWRHSLPRSALDLIADVLECPIAALLVTSVHREGLMLGVDLRLMEEVVEVARVPVLAAGGVGSIGDLWALHDRGLSGAVIGMALYTGALDPHVVAQEFPMKIHRETRETRVAAEVVLSPSTIDVRTASRFLRHMLETFARYAGLGLSLDADGDLPHHIVEDVAITLGTAIHDLVPATAARYAHRVIAMDDALVEVTLDLGGRSYYRGPLPASLYDHWMRSFAEHAKCTLHVRVLRGRDRHHVVEAAFKALGLALRDALVDSGAVFSTKGAVTWRRGNETVES